MKGEVRQGVVTGEVGENFSPISPVTFRHQHHVLSFSEKESTWCWCC